MKGFFLETLDYPDSSPTNNINGFHLETPHKIVIFLTKFMMGKFDLIVAEEYKFDNWAN